MSEAADAIEPSSCCSRFYEQDWVRVLAEDSFHPGGADLSRRTVSAMGLASGSALLDMGCGTGTTALMLAQEFSLQVTGMDLSAANVARARERAGGAAGFARGADFVEGDMQALPFDDQQFDGALAECVFSLMADKAGALAEIHRVLKVGGRVGLTDMAIAGPLAQDLADVVAPWTCLADALSPEDYTRRFRAAGFQVDEVADESAGLVKLISDVKRKLLVVGAGALFGATGRDGGGVTQGAASEAVPALDLAEVKTWLNRFRDEVQAGTIRYVRFQLTSDGVRHG